MRPEFRAYLPSVREAYITGACRDVTTNGVLSKLGVSEKRRTALMKTWRKEIARRQGLRRVV